MSITCVPYSENLLQQNFFSKSNDFALRKIFTNFEYHIFMTRYIEDIYVRIWTQKYLLALILLMHCKIKTRNKFPLYSSL